MRSSFAIAVALGSLMETVIGLRMSRSKPPQQPAVAMFDFDFDPESSISNADESRSIGFDTANPDYFLDHIRKAGGTTMYRWFKKVCELEHKKEEDCAMVTEGSSLTEHKFNDIFGAESSISVSVIHLREPVARAQSLVNMNIHDLKDICEKGTFEAHGIDPERCKHPTVEAELHRISGQCHTVPATTNPNIPMWNCWENMYVKSLVGTDRRNSTVEGTWLEVDDEDLELAKQRLAKFSGVLISEWLGHPAVAEYLSQHVLHLGQTIPFRPADKHDNDGYVSFTAEEWARVASENTYDKQLYEFAKELSLQRLRDAGFSVSPGDLAR